MTWFWIFLIASILNILCCIWSIKRVDEYLKLHQNLLLLNNDLLQLNRDIQKFNDSLLKSYAELLKIEVL